MSMHNETLYEKRLDDLTHKVVEAFGVTVQQLSDAGWMEVVDGLNDGLDEIMKDAGLSEETLQEPRERADIEASEYPLVEARERLLALLGLEEEALDLEALQGHLATFQEDLSLFLTGDNEPCM